MKAYIELTSVPIARENTPLLAPAAELAERLAQGGEAVELQPPERSRCDSLLHGVSLPLVVQKLSFCC